MFRTAVRHFRASRVHRPQHRPKREFTRKPPKKFYYSKQKNKGVQGVSRKW